MPAEDIGLVRRMVALRTRGETELGGFLAPGFVLMPDPLILGDARRYSSIDEWYADMRAAYPEYVERVAELIDLGGGRVLLIGTLWLSAEPHGFGSVVSWIVETRDGKLTRARSFLHQEEARSAAGLGIDEWPATARFAPAGYSRAGFASDTVDLLRSVMRVFAEEGVDAIEAFFAPDFEYVPDARLHAEGPVRSLAGTLACISATHPSQINDIVALADRRVLGVGVTWLRARSEGSPLPVAWIFEVREGRILRAASLLDQEQARLESGLAPEQWPALERFTGDGDGPLGEVP